jgi:hypothetical protein
MVLTVLFDRRLLKSTTRLLTSLDYVKKTHDSNIFHLIRPDGARTEKGQFCNRHAMVACSQFWPDLREEL